MTGGNLHQGIPSELPNELVTQLAGAGAVRIERIVSRGQRSEAGFWYDQEEGEYVLLVAGQALLEFEGGETRSLVQGDWLDIPPHVRHRVAWTAPDCDTIWLAVFYGAAG